MSSSCPHSKGASAVGETGLSGLKKQETLGDLICKPLGAGHGLGSFTLGPAMRLLTQEYSLTSLTLGQICLELKGYNHL